MVVHRIPQIQKQAQIIQQIVVSRQLSVVSVQCSGEPSQIHFMLSKCKRTWLRASFAARLNLGAVAGPG